MVLLLRGKSKCSVCGAVISASDEIVGFTAFLGPEHPLWRYSDSAMHKGCFAAWPDRKEFAALYDAFKERSASMRAPEALADAKRRDDAAKEAQLRDDREHNVGHARIMDVVRARGASCPHCGTHAVEYRELRGTARLRLACLSCARSFDASELRLP